MDQVVIEVKWMVDYFREIGQEKFPQKEIFVDNQGAITFTETRGFSERNKHVNVRYCDSRESLVYMYNNQL